MRNGVTKLIVCALCSILVSPLLFGSSHEMSLRISPRYEKNNLNLCFSFVYKGDKPIKIYGSDLPWGAGKRFTFIPVIENNKKYTLEKIGYISDPLAETMLLEPNKKYTGLIDLDRMYKNIEIVHEHSDISLVWSYTLRDWNGTSLSTVNGTTVIRKAR